MPEIIEISSERIEVEFPSDGCIVTIAVRHDDGDYFVAHADWLATGGIDMWFPAYIGTSDTLLEAWQRVYAYMGI